MIGRRVIRCDVIRQCHFIIPLLAHAGVQQDIIDRFELQKGVYRVAQQHGTGLWQAVIFVAHRVGAEQSGDLPA